MYCRVSTVSPNRRCGDSSFLSGRGSDLSFGVEWSAGAWVGSPFGYVFGCRMFAGGLMGCPRGIDLGHFVATGCYSGELS